MRATPHSHERWQLREDPEGRTYCAACGVQVIAPDLLTDYDPHPGLVARGVVSDEHDPETCEMACCEAAREQEELDRLIDRRDELRGIWEIKKVELQEAETAWCGAILDVRQHEALMDRRGCAVIDCDRRAVRVFDGRPHCAEHLPPRFRHLRDADTTHYVGDGCPGGHQGEA